MNNFLKRFELQTKGSSLKTEIIAGITTFFTMVYIVFVNPELLGSTGMNKEVVFITTCLIAAFGSMAMGFFANLPVALAPAMGLNAFFAYVVVGKMGYSWNIGMGAIFWGAVGIFLLSLFKIRYWLISSIPLTLRVGIGAGIGFFIALIGFKNMGLIIPNPATLMSLGDLHDYKILLGLLGFFIIVILASKNIYSGVLVSIITITLLSLVFDKGFDFNKFLETLLIIALIFLAVFFSYRKNYLLLGLFSLLSLAAIIYLDGSIIMERISANTNSTSGFKNLFSVVGKVDIVGALDIALLSVIFSFLLVILFDSSGTLLGVTEKAGLCDERGNFPKMKEALYVDSGAGVLGALMGTSAISAYVESSSGVSVGGRTGLTSIVVGILFLLTIFLAPLTAIVPAYATAGALVYVGILMASSLIRVEWSDLTEATPAFMTAVIMPFTYSITEGIAFGFISYCIMKTLSGKIKQIHLSVWAVAIMFILKFVLIS